MPIRAWTIAAAMLCAGVACRSVATHGPESGSPITLAGIDPLRTWFAAADHRPRAVALLSPT